MRGHSLFPANLPFETEGKCEGLRREEGVRKGRVLTTSLRGSRRGSRSSSPPSRGWLCGSSPVASSRSSRQNCREEDAPSLHHHRNVTAM